MFAGYIGVRTDVLTTEDITADILATTGEDIIDRTILALIGGMCGEFIDVRTGEVITDARRVAPFRRGFFFMGAREMPVQESSRVVTTQLSSPAR
jgi:hypothetical protein